MLKPDSNEFVRRSCLRAITTVIHREPAREYDVSLWFAVHHSGSGQTFRMYKLERLK
ncbi:hypothetical protein [Paraburkholderia phytofirmans]|uniref:hypothetical protein n=1 Tax=Paraburkholderia phytofirmans TaxID=261302 RepID=UPI0013141247|nr:hypothetical protein [Paraburkholderia phytofirmans]